MKYLLAEYATTFTASVFNIRQKNVVTSDPGFLNYRQTGEVESKGAELSAISRPTDNLTLIANYAYTHAINTEDDKYGANDRRRSLRTPLICGEITPLTARR